MSYQVLARKWRPQTFAEVVGQEHIGKTLKNAILQNRIGHAYLFVGSRGIGKTTSARIFAKALNCRSSQEGEPCCKCDNCLEIAQGSSLDVIEIDGASHNKVEDIRDIRDSVAYSPSKSRFKIYIIDEVHMLTTAAWNALLKTLEEPPEHVKFLFATTEPHKVLPTIISRCQRFDLRRIPVPLIVERLRQIADGEGVRIEEAALAAIARAADGGMRDAQSIFDQMIAFCGGLQEGELIREQDVIDVFGIASGSELRELTLAVLGNDLNRAMLVLQALSDSGRDLERLFEDLIFYVRNIMIATLCQDASRFLEVSSSELADLQNLGRSLDQQLVQRVLQELVAQEWGFRSALNKRIYLEVVLCRVITEAHSVQIDEVMTQLNVISGAIPREQMPEPRKQIVLPPLPTEILDRAAVPAASAKPEAKTAPPPPPAAPTSPPQAAAGPTSKEDTPPWKTQVPQTPQAAASPQSEEDTPPWKTQAPQTSQAAATPQAPQAAATPQAPQAAATPPSEEDTPPWKTQVPTQAVSPVEEASYPISASNVDALPAIAELEPRDEFVEDPQAAVPVQSTLSPEQLLAALLKALRKGSATQRALGEILASFTPSMPERQTLVLAYDQRKVDEHAVRQVLEAKNLALLKDVYNGINPLGNLVIDRWNPADSEEFKPGLRQVTLQEMEKLAEDPFVKLFNQRMGTTIIDARIPAQQNAGEKP